MFTTTSEMMYVQIQFLTKPLRVLFSANTSHYNHIGNASFIYSGVWLTSVYCFSSVIGIHVWK